jgi:hypothetical protein
MWDETDEKRDAEMESSEADQCDCENSAIHFQTV